MQACLLINNFFFENWPCGRSRHNSLLTKVLSGVMFLVDIFYQIIQSFVVDLGQGFCYGMFDGNFWETK